MKKVPYLLGAFIALLFYLCEGACRTPGYDGFDGLADK